MKIGDRIKLQRKKLQISQEALADACGWIDGRARVSNYENNVRMPHPNDIKKIADVLKITPEWLLFGVDERQKSDYSNESGILLMRGIPLLALDEVLNGNFTENGRQKMTVIVTSDDYKISKKAYFIEISGDSMFDPHNVAESYLNGDFALIEPESEPTEGDAVLVKHENAIKIRKLVKDGTEKLLKALNPQYPLIKLTSEVEILGVIMITQRNRIKK